MDVFLSGFGESVLFDEVEDINEVFMFVKDVELFGVVVKRNVILIEVFEEGIIVRLLR